MKRSVFIMAVLSLAALHCNRYQQQEHCTNDEQCPAGQKCWEGFCQVVTCEDNTQCSAGSICVSGNCFLVINCTQDDDCNGWHCQEGKCIQCIGDGHCPEGSHCEQGKCLSGCQDDANCPAAFTHCDVENGICVSCLENAHCPSGNICEHGRCIPGCASDQDCRPDEVCLNNSCQPISCTSREDCAREVCLVCKDGRCQSPPSVCQNDDCCLGYSCSFGVCVPEPGKCQSDADCKDPDFPRCLNGKCGPECFEDMDCPAPGQICSEGKCRYPPCVPNDCQPGQWCDSIDGECKPGCDENSDCLQPSTCNYTTHQCEQTDCCGGCATGYYCDFLVCQCVRNCSTTNPCPGGFECRSDGRCWCLEDSVCPSGSHCDIDNGSCIKNPCSSDQDCPEGWYCDSASSVCQQENPGDDGAFCFYDANCNHEAGYYCDNCTFCMTMDPSYEPSFTCRKQCSVLAPNCPANYECRFLYFKLRALCLPKP